MNFKCLLVGFGNIAQIHAKYLTNNNIQWDWYDPYINNNQNNNRILQLNSDIIKYNRIFILSPEKCHYDNYKTIRKIGYKGYIFIEKPAILNIDHIDIFDDKKVIVGMVERFNPAFQCLNNNIIVSKIINIDFSRCCIHNRDVKSNILDSIGIHDIDMLLTLLNIKTIPNYNIFRSNDTVIFNSKDPLCRIIWSTDTFFKERKIIVRQIDCTFDVDMQEQTVIKHYNYNGKIISESLYVEKSSPIKNEHDNLFCDNPKYINCKNSHELLFNIKDKMKQCYD